ncbi:MAG: hypothetical protein JNL73_00710 [Anaerolineales bacterium]|nr:hypothetical protein [Anaerolineales bacterium]
MDALWTTYGFYLWGLTTLLVIIALVWLGWMSFAPEEASGGGEIDPTVLERVQALLDSQPVIQASVGRALQFAGLEQYTDDTGRPAFALAVFNARGDGLLIANDADSGVAARTLKNWGEGDTFSVPEQTAVAQARTQHKS